MTGTDNGDHPAIDFVADFLAGIEGPMWICSLLNPDEVEGRDRKRKHRYVLTRDLGRIADFVKKRDEPGYGLYFAVTTMAPGQRRRKEFARELPFLFCDIDFKDIEATPEEVLAQLLALPIPPSRVHRSGNGFHVYWRLVEAATPDQHERAERLLKRLAWLLGGDSTPAHTAALLRMVGSHNTKAGAWKEVIVAHKTDAAYGLDEIDQWLAACQTPVITKRADVSNRSTDGNPFLRAGQSYKPPTDVEARLDAMRLHGTDGASVNVTLRDVSASLTSAGVDEDEIVERLLDRLEQLQGTEGWDWRAQEQEIRSLCRRWRKKIEREPQPRSLSADVVSLNTASDTRPRTAPILDPQDPMRSARAMYEAAYRRDDKDTLVRHRGEFFKWNSCCYQINVEEAQRGEIWRYLESARIATKDGTAPFRPKKDHVGNVHEALGAICAVDDYVEPPTWIGDDEPIAPAEEFFAASNGLLHLPTRTLYPPTPSYFGVTASSVAYDPGAPEPTGWLSFLQQTVADDEAIRAIQEWMGYTLAADTSQQKILFCIGPRRSGKGTFARIHTALLGKQSVGGPTMTSFGTQFGLAPLVTKSLAIVSDARIGKKTDRAAVTERLLTISGEDTIDIDRKYGTVWTGKLPTRIAILTNELPAFSEGSGALAGRFLVVHFQHSFFGREDHGLTDRLMLELPGILKWAIEGYERLRERGYFVQPANAMEQIEAIEQLGNPVKAFIQDRCTVGPAQEIEADTIYRDWNSWCIEHGGDAGNREWFGRNLRSAVPGLTTHRRTIDGQRVTTYRGIGIEDAA